MQALPSSLEDYHDSDVSVDAYESERRPGQHLQSINQTSRLRRGSSVSGSPSYILPLASMQSVLDFRQNSTQTIPSPHSSGRSPFTNSASDYPAIQTPQVGGALFNENLLAQGRPSLLSHAQVDADVLTNTVAVPWQPPVDFTINSQTTPPRNTGCSSSSALPDAGVGLWQSNSFVQVTNKPSANIAVNYQDVSFLNAECSSSSSGIARPDDVAGMREPNHVQVYEPVSVPPVPVTQAYLFNTSVPFPSQINGAYDVTGVHGQQVNLNGIATRVAKLEKENNLLRGMVANLKQELAALWARLLVDENPTGNMD